MNQRASRRALRVGMASRWWPSAWAAAVAAGCWAGSAAGEPPATVAAATALASDLARADASSRQALLAQQADALAGMPAGFVIPCLVAFGDATPGGANWLRSGLDRAADRLGGELAAEPIAAFVADTTRPPRARSLAYTWLKSRDAGRADRLLESMLDDPALDLRREAVEKLLASVAKADETAMKAAHRRALAAARDVDQVEQIVGWLGEHGETADLAAVLGFVRRWRVSDAFDNAKGVGFAKAYPPEEEGVAAAARTGWKEVVSKDRLGIVDLNEAVATKKGVLAYAVADVAMPQGGRAEIRIGSPCAVKVWVNGVAVMAHEIYHASEAVDQYVAPADFRAGTNTILVKCCQNEQTQAWAADWKFQLRVCDRLGTPLGSQAKEERR